MVRITPRVPTPRLLVVHCSCYCQCCCGRSEGVQGVLTLFGRGKARVCHDLRAVELKKKLEVEEENGDRQEEDVEEKGEVESKRVHHDYDRG